MKHLDEKSIETLAQLSRIHCSEKAKEALLRDLESILEYVDQLQEVDTKNIAPCNQVLQDLVNVFRADEVGETLPRESFLDNAPSQVGGLIRVPTVIKQKKG